MIQLEPVIVKISVVQVLRLIHVTNLQRVQMAPTFKQVFTIYGQASYLNMKLLVFAEPGHMQFPESRV